MRMRRKKHRESRLEACRELLVENINDYETDIKAIFQSDKPLCLEIGCGKGKFITETAIENPDKNFLAFEKNLDVLVLAAERAYRLGLTNVRFVPRNADYLKSFHSKSKCDIIYINFCDPWSKKRYSKRRLTHKGYLALWKSLLTENGAVFFKTDNRDLFEFSLNSFSEFGAKMKNISLNLHESAFHQTENIETEYEQLFSELGKPIYRLEAYF